MAGPNNEDEALYEMEGSRPDVLVVDPEGADEKTPADDRRKIKARAAEIGIGERRVLVYREPDRFGSLNPASLTGHAEIDDVHVVEEGNGRALVQNIVS